MSSMDKYIFTNIDALNRAEFLPNFAPVPSFDFLNSITMNKNCMNEKEIESFARINVNEFISQLYGCIEQDVYYMLNYAYDFLLNYFVPDSSEPNYIDDAILYWHTYDEDVKEDKDNELLNKYLKAIKKHNSFFSDLIIYNESNDKIKVSKLCPNFGLYVYKNIKDMFWCKSGKNEYDKYLLCRFLKSETCNFTESEFYLLEQITNINSVLTLSYLLSNYISTNAAKNLMENTDDSKIGKEIKQLILSVASSPLLYSKREILKKIFDESKKYMNLETEFDNTIKYITTQFNMISQILSCSLYNELHNKFPENWIKMSNNALETEKQRNEQEFISNHPNYQKKSLIKDNSVIGLFSKLKKANTKEGFLNVYIQKSFIDIINAPPKDSVMDYDEYKKIIDNNK